MTIIDHLTNLLPPNPLLTLSIGSGSGLLEHLLMSEAYSPNIHAVEISQEVNKYLSDERMQIVNGSWELSRTAKDAHAWLFVYPREVQLVKDYFRTYGDKQVGIVIWIGPMADVPDYQSLSVGGQWHEVSISQSGLSDFEAMLVWKRARKSDAAEIVICTDQSLN